jgi:hypothetical protein
MVLHRPDLNTALMLNVSVTAECNALGSQVSVMHLPGYSEYHTW